MVQTSFSKTYAIAGYVGFRRKTPSPFVSGAKISRLMREENAHSFHPPAGFALEGPGGMGELWWTGVGCSWRGGPSRGRIIIAAGAAAHFRLPIVETIAY